MQASLKRKKEMVQILREIEFVVKFELTAGKKLYKNFDTFFGFKEKDRLLTYFQFRECCHSLKSNL